MISYLKAEFYKNRRRLPNIILFILGILAIALSTYATAKFSTVKSQSSFFSNVLDIVGQVIPFIALLISISSFKRREELRNYFQKGKSRLNPVVGDLLVSILTAIIFAAFFAVVCVGLSNLFKDIKPEHPGVIYYTSKGFIIKILATVSTIICMFGGIHFFYELTNQQGATVAFGFLYYFFLPLIFTMTGLTALDSWIGKFADYFVKLAPITYSNVFENLFTTGGSLSEPGWFIAMLVVNLIVFTALRYLIIRRKKY